MPKIPKIWTWVCTVALTPGLCFALVLWPIPGLVATFVLMTFVAGFTIVLLRSAKGRGSEWVSIEGWAPTTTASAFVGAGLVSLAATTEVSPALSLLLILVSAFFSPWGMRRLTGARHRPSTISERPVGEALPVPPAIPHQRLAAQYDLSTLTNTELCTAWRASYVALQRAHTIHQRSRLVAVRQGYIDEMESRNPSALNAWLDSGARAASGPDRFLCDGPDADR